MKLCRFLIIVVNLFVLLLACDKHTNNTMPEGIETRFLDKNYTRESGLGNTLFSSIDYIPLKEEDDYLIGNIDKIIPYNDYFFLLDRKNGKVYKYDNEGNPKNFLFRRGGGPDEYIQIMDMDMDTVNNTISIFCFPPKLLITDFNLNIIDKAKTLPNVYCDRIVLWHNKLFIYNHHTFSVEVYDYQSNKFKKCIVSAHNKRKDNIINPKSVVFHKYKGDLLFQSPDDDCVYIYKNEKFVPYLNLDFATKKASYAFFEQKSIQDISLDDRENYPVPDILTVFEFNDSLSFIYRFGIRTHIQYYDTKYKNISQRFMASDIVYADNNLYGWDFPNNLFIKEKDYIEEFTKYMKNVSIGKIHLNENFENPVIVQYKLKK